MAETAFLDGPSARLAYAFTPGSGPVVVFLSGYKSDMEGTKALHLEAWCAARGQGGVGDGRSSAEGSSCSGMPCSCSV